MLCVWFAVANEKSVLLECLQVFMAKVLNRLAPKLSLGTIESRWVSQDPKQVQECVQKVFL